MLYLINYSTAKGSGSNLEQAQIQIPVSLTMTLDGIGGLQVGNIFTIDYLPKLYRDNVYFMITKVNHKVSTTGWETDLEAIMTVRMKEVWKTSGKQLEAGLEDYLELFKITNVTDYDGRFDEQIAAENIALGDANEKANEAAVAEANERLVKVTSIASGQNRGGNPFGG